MFRLTDASTSTSIDVHDYQCGPIALRGWVNEPSSELYRLTMRNNRFPGYKLTAIARLPRNPYGLIVCFHGFHTEIYPHFYDLSAANDGRYALVFPQDSHSSCWTGWLDNAGCALQKVLGGAVLLLSNRFDIKKTIYMGTSLGGFGALALSLLQPCDEVYVCSPVTSLQSDLESYQKFPTLEKCVAAFQDFSASINNDMLGTVIDVPAEIRERARFARESGCPANLPRYVHLLAARREDPADLAGVCNRDFYMPLLDSLIYAKINYSCQILPVSAHDALFYPSNVSDYSDAYDPVLHGDLAGLYHTRKSLVNHSLFLNSIRLKP